MLLLVKNKKDLVDVPESVRNQLEFTFAKHVDDALGYALEKSPFTSAPPPAAVEEAKTEVRA